ncbi:MAG: 50S ribosomal protein L29 [Chloroflexia bacterium]|nr:50S ribosomal protein L29 [Chloroflexia bacterium]
MKSSELIEFTDVELEQQLEEFYQELFNLRFQLSIGRLRNYKRISAVRRDIARIKTEQHRRRLQPIRQPQEVEA